MVPLLLTQQFANGLAWVICPFRMVENSMSNICIIISYLNMSMLQLTVGYTSGLGLVG